jgi:hypothetical protein
MASAASISDVYNFRQVSPDLASSGQPKEHQLAVIAEAGFNVIINLALHNDPRYSLPDEAASVRALGLDSSRRSLPKRMARNHALNRSRYMCSSLCASAAAARLACLRQASISTLPTSLILVLG